MTKYITAHSYAATACSHTDVYVQSATAYNHSTTAYSHTMESTAPLLPSFGIPKLNIVAVSSGKYLPIR